LSLSPYYRSAAAGKNVADGWGSSAYNVSKVGVSALTIIQQRQFDKDSRPGIVVNSVHPGYVDTDMTSHKGPLTIEQGMIQFECFPCNSVVSKIILRLLHINAVFQIIVPFPCYVFRLSLVPRIVANNYLSYVNDK
jgi:NAD(P)-dependent dehydrogenase (short-subunit alcohol dehydrogenase family)